ncbi:MAG: SDR family NAD(P)-dependent oxidoreductase [Flavobacteriales bacterium]|nr:SDR family NAD(P)-dependent oxidoreductase [Flavobacteriales bacterium]
MDQMNQKVAVVTGANRGIGKEIATQLSNEGMKVIVCVRDLEGAKGIFSSSYDFNYVQLDLGDDHSIEECAKGIHAITKRIDVLINNAGMLHDSGQSISSMDMGVFNQTMQVNAVGPLRLTRALLPLLNRGSRVVNVSSAGGQMNPSLATWAPAYCVSKALLNAITQELYHDLSPKGIIINSVCPGWTQTDMGGAGATNTIAQGADTPLWLAIDAPSSINGKFVQDRKVISW